MPPLKVALVRHGQSAANAGLPTDNHADVRLTELGERQAQEVARQISERPALIIASPFVRARQTAAPLLARYPDVRYETWPIGEFTYLGAQACANTTSAMRRPMVERYWALGDPHYVDGAGAESFASFVGRVQAFHSMLRELDVNGTVVVVGHGQFFRAFTLGLTEGLSATPAGMARFRAAEMACPMRNGEILNLVLPANTPSERSTGHGRT